MKDINTVLQQKLQEMAMIKQQIEALQLVAPLLADSPNEPPSLNNQMPQQTRVFQPSPEKRWP